MAWVSPQKNTCNHETHSQHQWQERKCQLQCKWFFVCALSSDFCSRIPFIVKCIMPGIFTTVASFLVASLFRIHKHTHSYTYRLKWRCKQSLISFMYHYTDIRHQCKLHYTHKHTHRRAKLIHHYLVLGTIFHLKSRNSISHTQYFCDMWDHKALHVHTRKQG